MAAAKPVTRIYRRPRFLVGAAAAAVATMLALSAVAPAGDVVDISGNEFSMSFGARASLDQNQIGRVVPIESLIIDESDSEVSG
jgi:hypothetical protein